MTDSSCERTVDRGKNYKFKTKRVSIPDWYTVPEGAVVYSVDDVYQGDI